MFDSVETLSADLEAFARRPSETGSTTASAQWVETISRVGTEAGRLILLLAAGKSASVPGVEDNDSARISGLMAAARRVVSEVFLAPGADYFLNLGLSPDATNEEIRDHFRRLMAIVHPDAQPVGFPPDAAVRVNRAYGILSSQADKTLYPDSLVAPAGASERRARVRGEAPPATPRPPAGSRWSVLLAVLRSRQMLLLCALVLLFPVVFLLLSGLRQSDPVRLVESRRSELGTVSPPTTTSSRDAMAVAASGTASASDGIRSAPALPVPVVAEPELRIGGMSLASGLSDRSLARIASTRAAATATTEGRVKVTANTSLAPSAAAVAGITPDAATNAASQQTPTAAIPAPLSDSASEATPRTSPAARDGGSAPPTSTATVQTGSGPAVASSGIPVGPVGSVARVMTTPNVPAPATRATEIDDLLVRFASAYESGSIANFAQLFSTNMNGRRQMLRDYERMFSTTQSRSIKFNQFKHNVTGERVATSGYATVTTIDQDNRIATQRVFLEFEISRDRGEPRIERLSNYAIN